MLKPFVSKEMISKFLNENLNSQEDSEFCYDCNELLENCDCDEYCDECGYHEGSCECEEESSESNDCSCSRGEACSNCNESETKLSNLYTGHIDNLSTFDAIDSWKFTKKGRLKPKSKIESGSSWRDLL